MGLRPNGTVAEVFEKPAGVVVIPDNGRWWINREGPLGTDDAGEVAIVIGDGEHSARFTGTPYALRRLCTAIKAHVEAAEFQDRHE